MPNGKLLESESVRGVHQLTDAGRQMGAESHIYLMEIYKEYLHYPPHLFIPNVYYLITGSVIGKQHYVDTDEKKAFLCETLFNQSSKYHWQLEAWACLSNHYHFVAKAPEDAQSMTALIRTIHSLTARYINRIDRKPGRRVWWNYWDTCIKEEKSYLAMLRYVHENPVKHQFVERAEDYPFCSYQSFLEKYDDDFRKSVLSQPYDQIRVKDDY